MSNPIEVTLTHRMNLPDEENLLDRMAQGVVSTPMDRPEGPLKVCGTATYADEDHPPGTAYGWFVRAAITSGRVTGLNTRELEAMPGVLAVIRDNRMIRNPAQGGDAKSPHQGPSEVFYKGQPIALVVAETFEQARDAALAARPDYKDRSDRAVILPTRTDYEKPRSKQSSQGNLDKAMRK